MNIEDIDWTYLIKGGELKPALREWTDGDIYPAGADIYYYTEKKRYIIQDQKIRYSHNENIGYYKADMDVMFKPFHINDMDAKDYAIKDIKTNGTFECGHYITTRDVDFSNNIKQQLRNFKNRYSANLEIINITKENLPLYIDTIDTLYNSWKNARTEQKKLFRARLGPGAFLHKNVFNYYDNDVSYVLFMINNKPACVSVDVPHRNDMSLFTIQTTHDEFKNISAFSYAYKIRYNKFYYRDLGIRTSKNVEAYKNNFTTHIKPFYFRNFEGEWKKEETEQIANMEGFFV